MAMSCPCELILSGCDKALASTALSLVSKEAWRIEDKFSRFKSNSVIGKINSSAGKVTRVDEETSRLLDCANTLYQLSEGLFDISAGALGRAWKFNQDKGIPSQQQLDELLPLVGWKQVHWESPALKLVDNMSIDFGGIGKEYAVDRCLSMVTDIGLNNALVNLGGDIAANNPRADNQAWIVGIEQVDAPTENNAATPISLERGGIATSGDQRRFILHNGIRYSHVLNPKTGWPVINAPKSVTTIASSATEAGMFSTLAMLSGSEAESFLTEHDVQYWIQR